MSFQHCKQDSETFGIFMGRRRPFNFRKVTVNIGNLQLSSLILGNCGFMKLRYFYFKVLLYQYQIEGDPNIIEEMKIQQFEKYRRQQ